VWARILDYAKMTLVITLLAGFLLFCGDWLLLLYKIARPGGLFSGQAFSVVTIDPIITSSLKNGSYNIYAQPPIDQTCINSLFPHQGYTPCWYLRRHTQPVTNY
jgi:hypothetical protein